jgi:hypothetical protein
LWGWPLPRPLPRDGQGRYCADGGMVCCGRPARQAGQLRCGGSALRAQLHDRQLPLALFQQPQRRIRRQLREPQPPAARSADCRARGA